MIEEKDRFVAVSDSGDHYTIVVLQHHTTYGKIVHARQLPGATEYKTDTGLDVDQIDSSTFKIFGLGQDVIVKKI